MILDGRIKIRYFKSGGKQRFLLIIVLLFTMNGCQEVQTSEVVGTWVMKEQSREWLPPGFEKSLGEITVLANGTFIAYELPEKRHFDPGKSYEREWRITSGSGTWKFVSISGIQHLHLGFNKFTLDSADDQDTSYGRPLIISKKWSKVIGLYYHINGPDYPWERIEFEKAK